MTKPNDSSPVQPNTGIAADLADRTNKLLARLALQAREIEIQAPFSIYAAIEELRLKADELAEWTEAELEEAAVELSKVDAVLSNAGRSLLDWLKRDVALIEEQMVTTISEDTRLTWLKLQEQAQQADKAEED